MNHSEHVTFESLGYSVAGPVLFDYVCWILQEAQKSKIDTLYFLARDGHLLWKIAQTICKERNLSIECRYLYCSRLSLRTPSYHLIGDEAYHLLGLGGYHVTLKDLLQRASMTEDEMMEVVNDLQLSSHELNTKLDKLSLERMNIALKKSEVYRYLLQQKSRAAYPSTMQYFRQEGLLDREVVAIVDSGWTGSMQRSLRQLLESGGFQGQLLGFYFGMYERPKDVADGIYRAWYFTAQSNTKNKILFSNNLLECMMAAPHGMTIGYEMDKSGIVKPQLKATPNQNQYERVNQHQAGVLLYAQERCQTLKDLETMDMSSAKIRAQQILYRHMAHPSKEEVERYGAILFCDDLADEKQSGLADASQVEQLKHYSILSRVWYKLFSKEEATMELFWPYGTLVFLGGLQSNWYRWNIYIWEWLRSILKRR